jgi:hypothetical protein
MKTQAQTTPTETPLCWRFLDGTERAVLLAINPDAEAIVNTLPASLVSQEQFYPFSPLGRTQAGQGVNPPWMPPGAIVTNANASSSVEIHHPQDPSFTKYETRRGIKAIARSPYQTSFDKLVKACMGPELAALPWAIYSPSGNGTQHVYLNCEGPGVNGDKKISLYVPVSYFASRNWAEVEALHMGVAVQYYKGSGFGPTVSEAQKTEWQEITASALVKPQALALRAIVES